MGPAAFYPRVVVKRLLLFVCHFVQNLFSRQTNIFSGSFDNL